MALSPLTPIPVSWENCLVDLQPTSQFGADHDTAMVNTTMLLQAPADEEVTFVVPMAEAAEQNPVMRVVADKPGEVKEFAETVDVNALDAEFGDELSKDEKAKGLIEVVKAEAKEAKSVKVKIKKGEQLLRFFYPQAVKKLEDGSFEFRILAPLASFVLNPSGGDISFAVGLPRVPGKTVTLASAIAENPPGTKTADLTNQGLCERQFVCHYLKQDPLYIVRYTYA